MACIMRQPNRKAVYLCLGIEAFTYGLMAWPADTFPKETVVGVLAERTAPQDGHQEDYRPVNMRELAVRSTTSLTTAGPMYVHDPNGWPPFIRFPSRTT
jgi:hypothetical protein